MKKNCFTGSLPIKLRGFTFFMSQRLGADSPRWERRNRSWGMRDKETDRERGRDSERKDVAVIHNGLSGKENVFL